MITIILAGGKGSRLGYLTKNKPKPMIKIGSEPIIKHIINIYKKYNYNKFIICTGYLENEIKKYFKKESDIVRKLKIKNKIYNEYISTKKKNSWSVILNNTGKNSMTGERLKRCKNLIDFFNIENFFFTYGDGVSSINLKKLHKSHLNSKKDATVTAVRPPARFGALSIKRNLVRRFSEKKIIENVWVSGGFFVLNKKVFNLLKSKNPIWEKTPLENLAKNKKLNAFLHRGFWKSMDTEKDVVELTTLFKKKLINKNA